MASINYYSILLTMGMSLVLSFQSTSQAHGREAVDLAFENINVDRPALREGKGRPSNSLPEPGGVPPGLRLESPRETILENRNESTPLMKTDSASDPGLETLAAVAATWTARLQTQTLASRELYDAGFFEALKTALNDPLLGEWDLTEGIRIGSEAPLAQEVGFQIGFENAQQVSEKVATRHIKAQFRDLSHEPRPTPRPTVAGQRSPLPVARKPSLRKVFEDYPLGSFLETAETDHLPDPWTMYRYQSHDDFYSKQWSDADRGFNTWLDSHRERALWSDLEANERAVFARLFKETFALQVQDLFSRDGERTYSKGYRDGWAYGSFIAYEWGFRRGYHQGFESVMQSRFESAFREHYPALYLERYQELFRDWSTSARPKIKRVDLDASRAIDLGSTGDSFIDSSGAEAEMELTGPNRDS